MPLNKLHSLKRFFLNKNIRATKKDKTFKCDSKNAMTPTYLDLNASKHQHFQEASFLFLRQKSSNKYFSKNESGLKKRQFESITKIDGFESTTFGSLYHTFL